MHHRRLILAGAAFAGVIAAFLAYRVFRGTGLEAVAKMRQSLTTDIPVGTSVKDAETRLRDRGFRVSPMTDASFSYQGHVREHLDYLYGDMSEGTGLVSRRWQVAVVHQRGSVSEICVSMGLVGP